MANELTPERLFLPQRQAGGLSADQVWRFYRNVLWERDHAGYGAEVLASLMSYKSGFGNLLSRHGYYRRAYCEPFQRALALIFRHRPDPVVLDLCCGTGTQAIAFALLGARVIAADYSESQLAAFARRRAVYERAAGRPLDITVHRRDLVSSDFAEFGAVDAIYSHIGIGRLVAAGPLLSRAARIGRGACVVVLKNGNPDGVWQRLSGRRAADSSPAEYAEAARSHGFKVLRMSPTTGVPRAFWAIDPLARLLDLALGRSMRFAMQCEYHFEKIP